jgi:hypothetical protein
VIPDVIRDLITKQNTAKILLSIQMESPMKSRYQQCRPAVAVCRSAGRAPNGAWQTIVEDAIQKIKQRQEYEGKNQRRPVMVAMMVVLMWSILTLSHVEPKKSMS